MINRVGVDDDEGPPVPIPNTEVKLISAEDTWLATARDNRKAPTSKQSPSRVAVFLRFAASPSAFESFPAARAGPKRDAAPPPG